MKVGKLQRTSLLFRSWCWTVPARDSESAHIQNKQGGQPRRLIFGEDFEVIFEALEADEDNYLKGIYNL